MKNKFRLMRAQIKTAGLSANDASAIAKTSLRKRKITVKILGATVNVLIPTVRLPTLSSTLSN